MAISAQQRKDIPLDKFAWPEKRKYPLDTAKRVRAAASYLVKEHNAGLVPDDVFPKAKARIRRAAKAFGIHTELRDTLAGQPAARGGRKGIAVRAHLGPGGHLHVRSLSALAGGKVVCFPTVALADEARNLADKPAPVWIQVAKRGLFKGHPAGEFELNDDVFQQIIANFKATANRRVPIDFEHASEASATDGTIPVVGAPAQGWIVDYQIRADGLWGLAEWLEPAREYIKAGQYKFFSPAIRFNSRDRVTGKPVGARMTSGALTNQPFLDGMAPLVARDFDATPDAEGGCILVAASDKGPRIAVYDDVPEVVTLDSKGALAHSPSEYMPAIRRALSMHALAPASECADRLDDLRDHLDAVDGDVARQHEGVDLSYPCMTLRSLVGAQPGTTWDEVFDVVDNLIQAAIGEHVVRDHGGAADAAGMGDDDLPGEGDDDPSPDMRDGQGTNQPAGGAPAANAKDGTDMDFEKLLNDEKGKTATLTAEKSTLATENAGLKTDKAELTLKVKDLEGQITAKDTELKTLRDEAAKRAEADLDAVVEAAFETYKDKKSLSDADKDLMKILAKANREKFDKAYPIVPINERHLMRDLSGGNDGPRAASTDPNAKPVKVSLRALSRRIAAERGISLDAAQRVAESIAHKAIAEQGR